MYKAGLLTRKAFQNLIDDFWLNLATICIIALCLTLVGAFLIVATNATNLVDHFAGQVEVMIFLEDGHTDTQVTALLEKLDSSAKVESATYVSKQEALSRFKIQSPELGKVTDELKENPLPASIEVRLGAKYRDIPDLESFAGLYDSEEGVEEVYYGKEWVGRLGFAVRLIWIAGIAVGLFLAGTAVFIISVTLKLTIYRRREEIGVMLLVGATNRYIQMPFIIEGLLQGFLGATFSIGALFAAYWQITHGLSFSAERLIPFFPGFTPDFLPDQALLGLVLMGVLVGFFGSLISVGKFLKQ